MSHSRGDVRDRGRWGAPGRAIRSTELRSTMPDQVVSTLASVTRLRGGGWSAFFVLFARRGRSRWVWRR